MKSFTTVFFSSAWCLLLFCVSCANDTATSTQIDLKSYADSILALANSDTMDFGGDELVARERGVTAYTKNKGGFEFRLKNMIAEQKDASIQASGDDICLTYFDTDKAVFVVKQGGKEVFTWNLKDGNLDLFVRKSGGDEILVVDHAKTSYDAKNTRLIDMRAASNADPIYFNLKIGYDPSNQLKIVGSDDARDSAWHTPAPGSTKTSEVVYGIFRSIGGTNPTHIHIGLESGHNLLMEASAAKNLSPAQNPKLTAAETGISKWTCD